MSERERYDATCAANKARMEAIRERMKERGLTGALAGRETGRSPSWINAILRGDYPHRGYYGIPVFLLRWLAQKGVVADSLGAVQISVHEGHPDRSPPLDTVSTEVRWSER